jgi:hypothetical protein
MRVESDQCKIYRQVMAAAVMMLVGSPASAIFTCGAHVNGDNISLHAERDGALIRQLNRSQFEAYRLDCDYPLDEVKPHPNSRNRSCLTTGWAAVYAEKQLLGWVQVTMTCRGF